MFVHLLAIAFLASACADTVVLQPSLYSTRIVGGENAKIETYPYQVAIQQSGYHICGGSIISKYYVLTAGHCVDPNEPTSTMSIRAGSSYRGRGGSIHRVEKIIRHENFNLNDHRVPINDLGVIKVTKPFVFSGSVKPIKLFRVNEDSNTGEMAIATGWGSTGGWTTPKQLQSVSLPIIERRLCSKAYRESGGVPVGQICAGYYGIGGKDACQGDSGGPLAIGGRLAGIVSWGTGCADPKFPGVFTEVAYYRRWINENAELY